MDETSPQLLDFEKRGRITVGTVHSRSVLSTINIAEFGNQLLHFIEQNPKINLILSFEKVSYLSSAVLTELIRVNKAIKRVDGSLRLCAVSKVIREVFEITNLDKIFVLSEEAVEPNIKRFERSLDINAQAAAWQEPTES